MKIHHATVKKAEANGIILTVEIDGDNNEVAQAHWAEGNRRVSHADAKIALAVASLIKEMRAEYPAVHIDIVDGLIKVVHIGKDEEGEPVITELDTGEGLVVPEKADILDACQEAEVDPEEGYEEGPRGRQVVPQRYKVIYAEAGHPNHCGDWLATFLIEKFTNGDGKFDTESFTTFLVANKVDMSGKWAALPESGQPGWQGRYRMNGRLVLEKFIVINDGLVDFDGTAIAVPTGFMSHLQDKHHKWVPDNAK